jgi:hypothetical protein
MSEKAEALKRYRKFHGHEPRKYSTINIPYPRILVCLGKGVAIEYESDKKDKNVPTGKNEYRHKFKQGVKIYTDKKGKILIITGGKFRVTDWMRD